MRKFSVWGSDDLGLCYVQSVEVLTRPRTSARGLFRDALSRKGKGGRGRSLTLQRPLGINCQGAFVGADPAGGSTCTSLGRGVDGYRYPPLVRYLGSSFMLQGHPIGNRVMGRVGALNQPPRPFYNRISLHQPTEPSSLKQLLGRLLVGGKGVPSNLLRFLACWLLSC